MTPLSTTRVDLTRPRRSRSSLDLATHRAIHQLEKGNPNIDFSQYADASSEKYKAMVEIIRKELNLTSLVFQNINDLVTAIGLPKHKLCTHCFDGSSEE